MVYDYVKLFRLRLPTAATIDFQKFFDYRLSTIDYGRIPSGRPGLVHPSGGVIIVIITDMPPSAYLPRRGSKNAPE